MFNPLDVWSAGEPNRAEKHNRSIDALNKLRLLFTADGTESYQFLGGTTIAPGAQPSVQPAAQFIITGNESGGGKYTATILNPPVVDVPAEGDLSADELGLGSSTVIRACNFREQGMSTHDLDSGGTYFPVRFTGYFLLVADDGVPVYVFDGRQGEDCT